jgi:hypothetical protein
MPGDIGLIAAFLAVRLSAVVRPERSSSAAAVCSTSLRSKARHCSCARSSDGSEQSCAIEVAFLTVLGRFYPRRRGLLVPSSRRDLGLAGLHNWRQTHSDQRLDLGPNTRIAFDSSVSLE